MRASCTKRFDSVKKRTVLDADPSRRVDETEHRLDHRAGASQAHGGRHWNWAFTEVVPVLLQVARLTATGLVRPVRSTPEAST